MSRRVQTTPKGRTVHRWLRSLGACDTELRSYKGLGPDEAWVVCLATNRIGWLVNRLSPKHRDPVATCPGCRFRDRAHNDFAYLRRMAFRRFRAWQRRGLKRVS